MGRDRGRSIGLSVGGQEICVCCFAGGGESLFCSVHDATDALGLAIFCWIVELVMRVAELFAFSVATGCKF